MLVGCQVQAGPERDISGQLLYERHCSRCHGLDGNPPPEAGGVPALSDPVRMGQLSDDHISGVIREGKPPRMPAFEGQFLEPSRKVLIAYVRSLSTPTKPEPTEAKAP